MTEAGARVSLLRRVALDVRPLRHDAFRRLWIGQSVSVVGFQLTGVAVAVEMFDITESSLWVGLIGVAALVPLVVFGLYGGAVSDAVDRRKLLIVSSYLTWTSTGGLLLHALLDVGSPAVLLGLVALQSVGFAFTSPTRGAVVPRIVPRDLLASANTLISTALGIGAVVGPLLAGLVLARSGYALAYGIDAALFTAGVYAAHRLPPIPPLGHVTRPGLASVVAGLAFISRHPVLLMSFAVDICAMVLAMPRALFPEVAEERFGGPAAAGWLFASIAIGSVAGGLLSGWIGRVRRQGMALIGAVVVWGLAVAVAGLARDLWLVVLLLAVGGAADLVSAVYRQTILQTYAPDEMRGRMQGIFIVVVAGGPRLGDLRAGASAAAFGVTASWVGGGIACVVIVLALAVAVPALRNYQAGDGPASDNPVEAGGDPR
ncbi:MAG TPA: MFS transporter [Actinomycetes bacterium]|nr:MFS transporter [Actinomycetes bacterium]